MSPSAGSLREMVLDFLGQGPARRSKVTVLVLVNPHPVGQPASQPASPARQPASQPAGRAAGRTANQPATEPADQLASSLAQGRQALSGWSFWPAGPLRGDKHYLFRASGWQANPKEACTISLGFRLAGHPRGDKHYLS